MRFRLVSMLATLLLFLSSPTRAADSELHIDAIAEFFALQDYPKSKANKAIAIGPGGAWALSTNEPTSKRAGEKALTSCLATVRKSKYASHRKQGCVLFDVNGKRTGKAEPIGIAYGAIPNGPDAPYLQGDFWWAETNKPRGIVLFLHGCNEVKAVKGLSWTRAWVAFYRAAGYSVALPDSFAEKRDPPSCGHPGESGINR
jgi:hypothetical protein